LRATLKRCEKFFENFGIDCYVYDIYNLKIYHYDKSTVKNKKIPNNPLYLLYHNNHLQKIDKVSKFSHEIKKIQENYTKNLNSLEKINFNIKTKKYNDFIIINEAIEIINIIQSKKKDKKENKDENIIKL